MFRESVEAVADHLDPALRAGYEESGLSAREVARALHTSTSQLYRLLDPTNYNKSLHQLLALLNHLGYDVDVSLTKRPPMAAR